LVEAQPVTSRRTSRRHQKGTRFTTPRFLTLWPLCVHGELPKLLAGDLFNKFGWHLSLAIVEEHYCRNRANITSSPETNIREFERIWEGIRNKKIEALSASERSIYEKLNTSSQQEAFFIVQSFDYCRNESADFPLAQLSLADRLNFTQRGAGYLIRRLKDLGTIKKTAEARIHNRPATYRWTANETVKDGM